jgi:hypothetical protein
VKKKVPMQKSISKSQMKTSKVGHLHGTHKKLGVPVGKPKMKAGYAKRKGPM